MLAKLVGRVLIARMISYVDLKPSEISVFLFFSVRVDLRQDAGAHWRALPAEAEHTSRLFCMACFAPQDASKEVHTCRTCSPSTHTGWVLFSIF